MSTHPAGSALGTVRPPGGLSAPQSRLVGLRSVLVALRQQSLGLQMAGEVVPRWLADDHDYVEDLVRQEENAP